MASISPHQDAVTLINTFTVRHERQYQLILMLNQAIEEVMKKLPGFISASIHQGIDGDKVINYAQWRSKEDYQAALKNPNAQEHMRVAASIADKFEPILCTVASSYSSPRGEERIFRVLSA